MAVPIPIGASPVNPYGVDGSWTAFPIHVGSNFIPLDVLVSTGQPTNYAVLLQACSTQPDPEACSKNRGGTFGPGSSETYDPVDPSNPSAFLTIPVISGLIGDNAGAQYGLDAVGLGDAGYTGIGPHLLGGVANDQLWLGLMGIKAISTSITIPGAISAAQNSPNIIQDLKNQSRIPSVSWGYTGGARYRHVNSDWPRGSLTLGGYDSNRFTPNDVSFPMNTSNSYNNYLSVYVQSIKATTNKVTNHNLLPDSIYASLDSTLSSLYLPRSACAEFESTFKLKWNSTTEYYYINPDDRKALLAQDPLPKITFTLATEKQGGKSVDITFTYSAFDLTLSPPLANLKNPRNYFPIKRSPDDSTFILGRTFFQEAYVIADFERDNFSVSQCDFSKAQEQNLVPIVSPYKIVKSGNNNNNNNNNNNGPSGSEASPPSSSDSSSSTNAGVIAGPVVAVIVIVILAVVGFWFWRRRRRQSTTDTDEKGLPAYSDHVAEMDGYGAIRRPEKTNTELEANESGRATPVPTDQHALGQKRPPGTSPLASPPRGPDQSSPHVQSPLSELDSTAAHNNTYFELPGSIAQRRSMGPHEMNAAVTPTEEPMSANQQDGVFTNQPQETPVNQEQVFSANQPSGPLPDLPEPSPPLETATTTSNPLTSGMETVPPPPPPK